MHHFLKVTDFTLEQAQAVFALAKVLQRRPVQHAGDIEQAIVGPTLLQEQHTDTRLFRSRRQRARRPPDRAQLAANTDRPRRNRRRQLQGIVTLLARPSDPDLTNTRSSKSLPSMPRMPIINGLTDFNHPCQLYTDIFTLLERYSPDAVDINTLKGKKVAFLGDSACNMANSWILTAAMFGMEIVVSGPAGYEPKQAVVDALKADGLPVNFTYTADPKEAVKGADAIYTDVWVSMGDEAEAAQRLKEMAPYQVNAELLALAKPGAYFMHCLPAHAGEEVSQEVLDSPQSIIFDEAENRLHAQKAIMAKLVELNS